MTEFHPATPSSIETPSIEASGRPLVERLSADSFGAPLTNACADSLELHTRVRALAGMQKEAIVRLLPGGQCWRMVSDEGPYLNGTDLAPFPLAFFAAAMQFSLLSELRLAAAANGFAFDRLHLLQDNQYTMNGSFIRGDARGGALPPRVWLDLASDAPAETVRAAFRQAAARCPVQALLRESMLNTFGLDLNGSPVRQSEPHEPTPIKIAETWPRMLPSTEDFLPNAITKVAAAQQVHNTEGGAGSSLQPEQKRTLHVVSECNLPEESAASCLVSLRNPIGSSFRFISDEPRERGGRAMAPPPLAYLAAGLGFCFMTQLGRYAHISKQDLAQYSITQVNGFHIAQQNGDSSPITAAPVHTHVSLHSKLTEDEALEFIAVAQRTCFLHAAMRTPLQTDFSVELNGKPLQLTTRGVSS